MLSTNIKQESDIKQESMLKRIEEVVSIIMEEDPLYKENLDYATTVQDLVKVFEENFSFDEFNKISEESLKNRCSGIMAVELLATIGDDFTPEQMEIFEDAIKRK